MKFGDLAQGNISRFDDEGRGVFDILAGDGKPRPFSVPFTTIGDEAEAKCIKRIRGRYIGKLERVTAPGPSRVLIPPHSPALPPYAPWLHIRYEDQLAFKRDLINRAFENAGHSERITEVREASPDRRLLYRNRMDFAFGWNGALGIKELGAWNRYLDLEDCELMEGSADVLRVFHEFMRAFPELRPWDAKRHDGDLRYVLVRRGVNTGDRLIALVIRDLSRINDAMRAWLIDHLDALATGICLSENPLITDLSYGSTIVPLKGDATFEEVVNGTRYKIHLNSFFQTNTIMAAVLQDTVYEMTGAGRRAQGAENTLHPCALLDLYCGLGFFGINFAQRNPNLHVHGFEIDEHAITLANENAKTNGVAERCAFAAGKTEDLSWKDLDAETCIIDPPRAGLHPKVINTLIERKFPRLVYVSCKYHRLVQELRELKRAYDIEDLRALDLFPHTPHVEVVVKMSKK